MTGGTNDDGPVFTADLYDPAADAWLGGGVPAHSSVQHRRCREYHSTALLLPDGSVLLAGGDSDGVIFPDDRCPRGPSAQIYRPGYFFRGGRPVIESVSPGPIRHGGSFTITMPEAPSQPTITAVALIRPGSVTHSTNTEQKYVRLDFVQDGRTITATAPPDDPMGWTMAPPGYYLVTIVRDSGAGPVPAESRHVQILPH